MITTAPKYTKAHANACAFHSWYPELKEYSIKSTIIPLPSAFITLLLADGIHIESEDNHRSSQEKELILTPADLTDLNTLSIDEAYHYVQLKVKECIHAYKTSSKSSNRYVFPKLNWSAPRDARWMLGTLKCQSFEDIFLLLKSSDFITHDLTQPYIGCENEIEAQETAEDYYLVLKKWCQFIPSMIFRCFIKQYQLVAISQRHYEEYYLFLNDIAYQEHLIQSIESFYDEKLKPRLERMDGLNDTFILDIYMDKQEKLYLLDINIYGQVTDPCLYTWEELEMMRMDTNTEIDFRVVENENETHEGTGHTGQTIQPSSLSCYRTPMDMMNLGTKEFEDFMKQVQLDQEASSSDDENEAQDKTE